MTCRDVAFAGSRVRIGSRGDAAREIVEFVCRDMRGPDGTAQRDPRATFVVEEEEATRLLTVREDDVACYRGASRADAARALAEGASRALAAGSRGGLLFHAASVSRSGRAVLLPGASGSGKTTLAAHLAAAGTWRLLSDELSFVAEGSSRLQGLPRPLHVKPSGRSVVEGLLRAGGWHTLTGSLATLLQPPLASDDEPGPDPVLHAIVFPHYRAGARTSLTQLAAGACGLRAMACLLNARNLEAHGFPAVVELAARTPVYSLVHGGVAFAAAELEGLLREGREASNRP